MGLLSEVLLLPLAPLRGSVWVLDQVVRVAEDEYYDPAPVRAELRRLEAELVAGRMTEEEFEEQEDLLLDRLEQLEEIQRARRRG
ncbi:gas vesicle protein GvpG [Streptomyces bohaiensis]|uniref:gas vesicle protein GvpG n=1 Tax=Streptomyces bohaiensis TaxID=1431344 RepID=UPI003B7CA31D